MIADRGCDGRIQNRILTAFAVRLIGQRVDAVDRVQMRIVGKRLMIEVEICLGAVGKRRAGQCGAVRKGVCLQHCRALDGHACQ